MKLERKFIAEVAPVKPWERRLISLAIYCTFSTISFNTYFYDDRKQAHESAMYISLKCGKSYIFVRNSPTRATSMLFLSSHTMFESLFSIL